MRWGVLKWSGEERSDSERNGRTPPSAVRSDRVSEWPPDRTSESPPDPEVAEKAHRRRFTAEYKAGIVREADGCREPGQIGALLRREGLYSSQLVQWRRQSREGAYHALRDDHRNLLITIMGKCNSFLRINGRSPVLLCFVGVIWRILVISRITLDGFE
jgi:transposase-like protein